MRTGLNTGSRKSERGASLVEFTIAAAVFLTVTFAVLEFGRALWVYNALADAARKGARYAAVHDLNNATVIDDVKRIVVYGNPAGTGSPVVDNLSTTNVDVTHPDFGLDQGTVSVSINNYQFQFVLPLLPVSIQMPSPTTTLTGECAGLIPADL
jgi:Flp pilus assembly protein TadG